jgi:hypothetical protein
MMTARSTATHVFRIVATVLALAPLIGLLTMAWAMIAAFQAVGGNGPVRTANVALPISVALYAVLAGLVLFPMGVYLHWIIAKRTGGTPSWGRQALFWGSLFACVDFPWGTIMAGVTIWLLVGSRCFDRLVVSTLVGDAAKTPPEGGTTNGS